MRAEGIGQKAIWQNYFDQESQKWQLVKKGG